MAALEGGEDSKFELDLSDEMGNSGSGSGMNIEPRTQQQDEA